MTSVPIRLANLTAIVQERASEWWIRLKRSDAGNLDVFETWRAVLIWAGQVMPAYLATISPGKVVRTIAFDITMEDFPDDYDFVTPNPLTDADIDAGIELQTNAETKTAHLHLKANWFRGFYRLDNYAERCLGVRLLQGACQLFRIERSLEELHALVLSAAGSTDFRHRHAFRAERAIDNLVASNLTASFSPIPVSAGALAKCGSAWDVHPRGEGPRIAGKVPCLAFIEAFVARCHANLLREVANFDKRDLVITALRGLQSAIAEEGHWRRSARALRAIHGVERDFEISLKHATSANGVLRANSMLAELAAVVAKDEQGRKVGRMEMEELQAKALQLFLNADNYPAFRVDRIKPSIHISPTGDVMYSHDFHEAAIQRNAELQHARERSSASDSYAERFKEERAPASALDASFAAAVRHEYGVPLEVFREFSVAAAQLACITSSREPKT